MRTRTTTTLLSAALLLALTGCSSGETDETAAKPAATKTSKMPELTPEQKASVRAAAGIPEEPTGPERTKLLAALAAVAPDAAKYEEKAISAAQNQCSAINGGANRLDWLASQRFTYKDVTTTEAQGKELNQVLRDSKFCQV